jgi:hypothetical protein
VTKKEGEPMRKCKLGIKLILLAMTLMVAAAPLAAAAQKFVEFTVPGCQ